MMRRFYCMAFVGVTSVGMLMFPQGAAWATGPYDGVWMVNASGTGAADTKGKYVCPPIHVTLEVVDGKISGTMEHAYGDKVVDGYDHEATPVTGMIGGDGKVTVNWKGLVANDVVNASGHATANHLAFSWDVACGERTAVGERY
jgi:hypothetical protein